jgi:Domain of unknown function (DUF4272)
VSGSPSVEDDLGRRRERTYGYLRLWGIDTDLTLLPIVRAPLAVVSTGAVCGRAAASVLVALKGQGLSQVEVFAFADAYAVWPSLTADEDDFVLDDAPSSARLVQHAWRYEQAFVYEWALGLIPHLRFPDAEVDTGRVTENLMQRVLTSTSSDSLVVRTAKELADSADIAFALQAIAAAGDPPPLGMLRSVVEERAAAFEWLLSPGE